MQTQPIHPRTATSPWLERYPADGGSPERILLETFPFTIGRNDGVDLQVASSRVSRQHAVIVKEGGRCRIEDLGSTNGTFVNGRRVAQAMLDDGDLVLFADAEFTFFSGRCPAGRKTVTEVIGRDDAPGGGPPLEVIRAVRRAREVLTHRAVLNRFEPIVRLDDGGVLGYEALPDESLPESDRHSHQAEAREPLPGVECRLNEQMRYLQRLLAVEEASALAGQPGLLLNLHAAEIGSAALCESLVRLREALPAPQRLVVEVPEEAFSDTPAFRGFHIGLKELGIGLACDGFAAGQTQLGQLKQVRPDFLKLAPALVRRLHTNRERQRRLGALVRASREMEVEVIVTGVEAEEEAAVCRELGCGLGQGPYFGDPQPAYALLDQDQAGHAPA